MTVDFSFADYGSYISGAENLVATGSTQADALPLLHEISHFGTVPAGSGCKLPYTEASVVLQLTILNRGGGSLLIYPAEGGQIEQFGLNAPLTVPSGMCVMLWCFDQPTAPGRQWFALTLQ